ncbi:uncharacterized protein LOC119846095 isoform X1 [Dermochelys coriacea]|uniref:uncharacterized protein LOC119846095 isoform X1 n=1 Tax=Dermochelys coriacea TaxID=27794 RepID=UPI001CA7DC9A|nr:uncharacterized protein LOC119846095 isoform X1 [Dermochelys coriacea]
MTYIQLHCHSKSATRAGTEFMPANCRYGVLSIGPRTQPSTTPSLTFPHPSLPNRWQSFESKSARSFTSNIKRHSEGTFTSDFTRYLDKMKAKDFVHWLINTKRYSSTKRYIKGDHVISFPSDHSLFRSD